MRPLRLGAGSVQVSGAALLRGCLRVIPQVPHDPMPTRLHGCVRMPESRVFPAGETRSASSEVSTAAPKRVAPMEHPRPESAIVALRTVNAEALYLPRFGKGTLGYANETTVARN